MAQSLARPLGAVAAGAVVALALGTYGRVHDPTGVTVSLLGFSSVLPMKAWLTTGAVALAVVQLVTALRLFGHLGHGRAANWVGPLHRWSGAIAFTLTVPVAFQCLWSLGFETYDTRTTVHSLLGCAFYGAFAAKMLALRDRHGPPWLLPLLGGLLLTLLTGIWMSASLWFFTNAPGPMF
ncbi:MAG: DUF6529 family protein [Actinomycetes bacterium]